MESKVYYVSGDKYPSVSNSGFSLVISKFLMVVHDSIKKGQRKKRESNFARLEKNTAHLV